MGKILTRDEVMDTLDCASGHGDDVYGVRPEQAEAMESVRASHEALRDLLRQMLTAWDRGLSRLPAALRDDVEAAIRAEFEAALGDGG